MSALEEKYHVDLLGRANDLPHWPLAKQHHDGPQGLRALVLLLGLVPGYEWPACL